MSQSTVIFGALILGFILYLSLQGKIGTYEGIVGL